MSLVLLLAAGLLVGGRLWSEGAAPAASDRPLALATTTPSVSAVSATTTPSQTPASSPSQVASPSATPEPNYNEVPVPADDPVALAQQLATVETAIRDSSVAAAKLVWMGHLQQLDYSRLVDYPDWVDPVLAALPANVRPAIQGSLEASKQLHMMSGVVPTKLPDWHIVAPAPVDDLLGYYKEAETTYGVPWYYLAAINLIESRMGRIRGDSSAGAQGPMQFIPSTWAAYGQGGDVNDPHDAILAAARYLKAAGAPGNMAKAVYAYNHETHYVAAVTAYAEVMHADPAALRGYYGWQVYYSTPDGPILLPVGWSKS